MGAQLPPAPFFKDHRLPQITAAEVDRYKTMKTRQGKLGPSQISKTLKRLSQILDLGVDYEHIPSNPAASRGGRRRVKESTPTRAWVEPEQLLALIDAAPRGHRPILATLAGAPGYGLVSYAHSTGATRIWALGL